VETGGVIPHCLSIVNRIVEPCALPLPKKKSGEGQRRGKWL
jgi:hypothetical protein